MDLPGKLGYLWEVVVQPASLVLVLGVLALGIAILLMRASASIESKRTFLLVGMVLLTLVVGVELPTPTWYQYFFAPLPFVVLCAAYFAGALCRKAQWTLMLGGLIVAVSFLFRPASYTLDGLNTPMLWTTMRVHDMGVSMRDEVRGEPVLTFAPIIPLEGGLPIYGDFAAGPFSWRSITLLSEDERKGAGLMSPGEVNRMLNRVPPKGILVGFEPDLERAWIDYAHARNYHGAEMSYGAMLFYLP